MTDQPALRNSRSEALGSRIPTVEKSLARPGRDRSLFGAWIAFGLRTSDFEFLKSVTSGRFRALALLSLLLLSLLPASAQTNTRAARPDFASFRIITDRNIFSPSRTASRPMRYETRTTTQPTARRGDYFTLVGTMEYEKGAFAFFDGTSSEFRKTLKPGDAIAGYKLGEITQHHVRLTRETNTLELKVGMQMRHSDDGVWTPVTPTEASVGSAAYVSTTTRSAPSTPSQPTLQTNGIAGPPGGEGPPIIMVTGDGTAVVVPAGELGAAPEPAPAAGAAPAPAGGEDEVLRRLMQRREQEMNR